MLDHPAMELSGYAFETLGGDELSALYRAWDENSDSRVLVHCLLAEDPTTESLKRLEHEHSLREALDPSWAARPIVLTRHQDRPALVLEDGGGAPLDALLDGPMDVASALRLAVSLAGALDRLHQRGIIHKDIKPANVLASPATGQCWLTGFGIASRLPRERQSVRPPEYIAGTLAYMAPEQTGRMNRSIDSRSDLYSLGVTLYELFTGGRPFGASDPMEWVHCHIAKKPIPPAERSRAIPAPVSAIIMKLLAKAPEERYQTAAAAEKDLRRCLDEWGTHGRIDPFELGEYDVPRQLVIPERLYGRQADVETLVAAFDRVVASGTPELVLVSGYSGIGKSTVVHELHRVLVPPRGLFASGKFDQYRRDIPYTTFAQAFQQLVQHVLGKSDAEIAEWRRRLELALGANGKLMVELIPELELIIGPQPDVVELSPQDARKRFQRTLLRFVGAFASREHPLALFIDDLQWVDAASLDLLVELATDPEVEHLLLLGAYRDNEVGKDHPLLRATAEIRRRGARVPEIALAPLRLDDVAALLGDTLHSDRTGVMELASLVRGKTGGNPFFVIQFVTALADDGLLAFNSSKLAWDWDVEQILGTGFTDNVVHLMVERLSRLPDPTREALFTLACLGHAAGFATLCAALAIDQEELEEELDRRLWPAVLSGVVFRHEDSYAFLHDRVQEAAYALVAPERRPGAHLLIGRRLLARWNPVPEEMTFEIAGQLNRGAALIDDSAERLRLAELNLAAGKRAKASAAYALALGYMTSAAELLPADAWESRYALAREVCFERASCHMMIADFDAAEALILELRDRGTSNADKSRGYRLHIELAVLKAEYPLAVERSLECLRLFDIEMSAHPSREEVEAAFALVEAKLGGRSIESLIDLPRASDEIFEAAMAVLSVLYAPAVFTDLSLTAVHLCHMVALTLDRGITDASTHAFGWFGILLGQWFDRCQEGFRFGKLARELVIRHGFAAFESKSLFSLELVSLWTSPLSDPIESIRAARERGQASGDITVACYACNHLVSDMLARGDALDAIWPETESGLAFARRAGFRDVIDILVPQQRFIRCMQGRTLSLSTFDGADFTEAEFEAALTADRMPTMMVWYWIIKGQARFIASELEEAAEAFEKAAPLMWSSPMHVQNLDYFYFGALSLAALASGPKPAPLTPEQRRRLDGHHQQLCRWVESYPPTFADKERLVAAEIARLDGADLEAMRLYEEAIRLARQHGFVQNEAIACEVSARFHSDRGFERIALAYREGARAAYERWGATGKVRQLDALHPQLRKSSPASDATTTIRAEVEHLDLATVIKVSRAVTSEMVLEKLVESLMRTAIAHAGAERGVLFLSGDGGLQAEAEATTRGEAAVVGLRASLAMPPAVPESIVRYVARVQESVIIDDAAVENRFSSDPYLRQQGARSVLCLPLVNQGNLLGVLYLENALASHVFTPDRIGVLRLLASQAAVSLANARLYSAARRAEEELRTSQERYAVTLASIGDGVIATDDRSVVSFMNPVAEALTGWPDDEAIGRPLGEIFRVEERDGHPTLVSRQGRTVPIDERSYPLLGEDRVARGIVVVFRDMTERRRAEDAEALRIANERLELALCGSKVGIWDFDAGASDELDEVPLYTINIWEPLGYPAEARNLELYGRYHPERWFAEDRPRVREAFTDLLLGKTSHLDVEHRVHHADGSVRWFIDRGILVRNADGVPVRMIGSIVDITELKDLQEQLRNAKEAAESANTAKDDFLANVSHEIRTPMNAILGMTELVLDPTLTDEQRQWLRDGQVGGREPARDHRRAPRLLEAPGEQDGARGARLLAARGALGHASRPRRAGAPEGPGAHRRRRRDRARRAGRRSRPPAAGAHQSRRATRSSSPEARSTCDAEGRAVPRRRDRLLGDRHRRRHPAREARAHLRAVRAGGFVDDPRVRRHRPRPHHRGAARGADGRRDHGDERARPRQHLQVPRAPRAAAGGRECAVDAAAGRRARARRRRQRRQPRGARAVALELGANRVGGRRRGGRTRRAAGGPGGAAAIRGRAHRRRDARGGRRALDHRHPGPPGARRHADHLDDVGGAGRRARARRGAARCQPAQAAGETPASRVARRAPHASRPRAGRGRALGAGAPGRGGRRRGRSTRPHRRRRRVQRGALERAPAPARSSVRGGAGRERGARPRRDRTLRVADARPAHARRRRLRGDREDSRPRARGRRVLAGHRTDRALAKAGSRPVPRRRNGRVHRQTDPHRTSSGPRSIASRLASHGARSARPRSGRGAQRGHRVDARGAARRQPAGDDRDGGESAGDGDVGQHVRRRDAVEEAAQEPRQRQRAGEPDDDAREQHRRNPAS